MISLSYKEFEKSIVKNGEFEVYTQDQFDRYINANLDLLKKGEFDTLSDIEKSEYEALKEEIKGFGQIEVVSPSKESAFRIEKAIMYVRPVQVEWDEPELIKGEDGTEIMKARGGRYTDTPTNRKLGRVGQKYGGKKGEKEKDVEHSHNLKVGEKVNVKGVGEGTFGYKNKEGFYVKFKDGSDGFFSENQLSSMKDSNSKEGDDKGKERSEAQKKFMNDVTTGEVNLKEITGKK